ncbi:MAG: hypothetical protein JSR28_04720 [Proteobacteria bacterium]|nr:hypothetical protein [Pseudomonadota bacterium]
MGDALARRLQLAFPLHINDLSSTAFARMVERGTHACTGPLAKSDELRAIVQSNDVIPATDLAGTGTNALCLPPGTNFQFHVGEASRQRHVAEALRQGLCCRVVQLHGLVFDPDTVADYDFWL